MPRKQKGCTYGFQENSRRNQVQEVLDIKNPLELLEETLVGSTVVDAASEGNKVAILNAFDAREIYWFLAFDPSLQNNLIDAQVANKLLSMMTKQNPGVAALKGNLKGLIKEKFGKYRIILSRNDAQKTLTILDIGLRKSIYKK
jgi:mRNA-degrading endonuclease RelE of RelBE toxin-antitoxin system